MCGPSPCSPLCPPPLLQDGNRLAEPEPLLGGGVHGAPAPGLPPPGLLRAGRGHGGVCAPGPKPGRPRGGGHPKAKSPPSRPPWMSVPFLTGTLPAPSPQARRHHRQDLAEQGGHRRGPPRWARGSGPRPAEGGGVAVLRVGAARAEQVSRRAQGPPWETISVSVFKQDRNVGVAGGMWSITGMTVLGRSGQVA